MSEFINIQNENPIIINKIKFYEDEQQVEIPTVVKQNVIQEFKETSNIEGSYSLDTDNCMFSNVERRNDFYEDCLELMPILSKNSIDLNKDRPLLKNNYLSEFKTESDKYQARYNLGIRHFELLNQLDEIIESGNYIARKDNQYIPLIVFNTPNGIYQIAFIGINSIHKRIGINQSDRVVWEQWSDVIISDNSVNLTKLSTDLAEKIVNTQNQVEEFSKVIPNISKDISNILLLLNGDYGVLEKVESLETQIDENSTKIDNLENTISRIPYDEIQGLISTVSKNTEAIEQEISRAQSAEDGLLQLINKTVYLTQEQYNQLVNTQQILDDVEYNIFEDE